MVLFCHSSGGWFRYNTYGFEYFWVQVNDVNLVGQIAIIFKLTH